MSSLGRMFDQLNFFAAASVIGTTALTVVFFEKYAKKKLPPADGFDKQEPTKEISGGWYAGLFCAELYGQFVVEKNLDATDAVLSTIINTACNILVFFICYGILSGLGVNKENLYKRCQKAFIGLVILSFALLFAFDNFVDMPNASNQNVPAVTQEVQAEYVTTLNGENIYIYRDTLVRTNNTNEDAAPEFKCVLIDTAEVRTNCEFKARGVVVMYIDGVEVGNSIENPDIGELYSAIVKKFL